MVNFFIVPQVDLITFYNQINLIIVVFLVLLFFSTRLFMAELNSTFFFRWAYIYYLSSSARFFYFLNRSLCFLYSKNIKSNYVYFLSCTYVVSLFFTLWLHYLPQKSFNNGSTSNVANFFMKLPSYRLNFAFILKLFIFEKNNYLSNNRSYV